MTIKNLWQQANRLADQFYCEYLEESISNAAKGCIDSYMSEFALEQIIEDNNLEILTENFIDEHTKGINGKCADIEDYYKIIEGFLNSCGIKENQKEYTLAIWVCLKDNIAQNFRDVLESDADYQALTEKNPRFCLD